MSATKAPATITAVTQRDRERMADSLEQLVAMLRNGELEYVSGGLVLGRMSCSVIGSLKFKLKGQP